MFQKVKNAQHFYLDEHFREGGLEQLRTAITAAIVESPKKECVTLSSLLTHRFKSRYMKFVTMLEELSVEKLKRNEHPVLSHDEFIFMANTGADLSFLVRVE